MPCCVMGDWPSADGLFPAMILPGGEGTAGAFCCTHKAACIYPTFSKTPMRIYETKTETQND